MRSRSNLAGRAGRWSAGHWKAALFGWLAFALVAMIAGNVVGHVQMRDSQYANGEVAKAIKLLEAAHFKQPALENVLIQSRSETADSPGFNSAVSGVVQTLAVQKDVANIQNPLVLPGGGGHISRDGHSVLVQFTIKGDPDKAKDKVEPILKAVAGVQSANPRMSMREVGVASANYELDREFKKDFGNAEKLTIPITLLILLASFGSLVAAGLPVLLAFSAVLASLGLFAALTHVYAGDFQSTSSVILLIGMAVGVDYSLFYLRREQEERAAGSEPRASLFRAASTSGQAVLISGATVLIAMSGMFIAGSRIFTGMAIGTMLVVLCAMIGSLTVLPAVMSKLGDRVDRGRVPYIGRRKHAASESRFWGFVLDRVLRRPLLAVVGRGRVAAPGGDPDALDAHEAPELHRHAAAARDRPDLQGRARRLPGRADAGGGRRPREERPRPGRRCLDRRTSSRRQSRPGRCSGRSSSRSAPTTRSPTSRSRSPATATTRPRSRHSTRCARRCCRGPSARSRASSTRSPARPRARTTSTS